MATLKMYGIPNCDTVKKARTWIEKKKLAYEFHDYKKLGVDEKKLKGWCKEFGYEQVLNQKGTTWRKLDEKIRAGMTEAKALKLMQEQPSVIKRPIVEQGETVLLGFNEALYESLF